VAIDTCTTRLPRELREFIQLVRPRIRVRMPKVLSLGIYSEGAALMHRFPT
jgi:hypothetical protein